MTKPDHSIAFLFTYICDQCVLYYFGLIDVTTLYCCGGVPFFSSFPSGLVFCFCFFASAPLRYLSSSFRTDQWLQQAQRQRVRLRVQSLSGPSQRNVRHGVSDISGCSFIVMIDSTLTTQHAVLTEAHHLNEASGNQLFLKFPSWKWSTATQIILVCSFLFC